MADNGVAMFDLGSALPWAEDKIRALFGKDHLTLQRKAWLKQLHDTAVEMTRSVQCVGMQKPVPFEKIYQPTKLRVRSGLDISTAEAFHGQNRSAQSIALARYHSMDTVSVESFLESPENAVIFAGPGWGKTTFLHYIFRQKNLNSGLYTVLIALRRPTAIGDLEQFTEFCLDGLLARHRSKILLLVDGYDEVSTADRKKVSDALLRFSSARIGRFILTCRDHYSVIGLNASQVHVDCFDKHDKYRFVTAFLCAFESPLDPIKMVNDLEDRELSDFLSHPLLLALACIVKCGKSSEQPRSAIRLLERALMTLQYAWDTDKGIDRERLTNLDASDRMHILRCIAFASRSPFMQAARAEMIARKAIDQMQVGRVDPVLVLRESAQFYGILMQSSEGWEFVHRSIQDYLAAKRWVELGAFANERRYQWDTRTAYAACISGDSTKVLVGALDSSEGLTCVTETLMNAPAFDMKAVSEALKHFYSIRGRTFVIEAVPAKSIAGGVEVNLFEFLSNRFLNELIEQFCKHRTDEGDVLMGYCIAELRRRRLRMDYSTFAIVASVFPNLNFQFKLAGGMWVTPNMACPVAKI
jgi:hypothetical protein